MRSILKSGVLAAGLIAGAASTANAQWFWQGCAGTSFNTCASVTLAAGGANQLVVTVQNWGNWDPTTNAINPSAFGTTFTTVGVSNIGATLTGLISAVCTNDACSWVYDNPAQPLSNGANSPYGGGSRTSQGGVSNGLNAPTTPGTFTQVVFTFSYTGVLNLDGADFGLHGQEGPADCGGSTKLFIDKAPGSAPTASVNTSCVPPTTVPEPATMGLLALGLVGMAGAGLVRRRKV